MTELAVPPGMDPEHSAYVENPVTGERFQFRSSPDEAATEALEFDVWASPEMSPLPEHVHPKQDETFTVHSGTIEVTRTGVKSRYGEDAEVTIEAGIPHSWTNADDARLHLTVRIQPGLQTEAFLRDLATLAQRGEVKADGEPPLLWVAALYDAYGYELLHLANPPLRIQKILFGALAPVASGLGYCANPVEASGTDGRETN